MPKKIKNRQTLESMAWQVLDSNDCGKFTKPAPNLYPHQWLWDSCFIAIGLRWRDFDRAQQEIMSLFDAQWENGMIPHTIFSDSKDYHAGPNLWKSKNIEEGPKNVETSGITQPPMIAQAVVSIGQRMDDNQKIRWYKSVFHQLVRYHLWMYQERDIRNKGLVSVLHSWESGTDNSPVWMTSIADIKPLYIKTMNKVGVTDSLKLLRKDTKEVPATQRMSNEELFTTYDIIGQLKKHKYDPKKILEKTKVPVIEDVLFNSILLRANVLLAKIADEIGEKLPELIVKKHSQGIDEYERLFEDDMYWSRDVRTGQLIKEPTFASLMGIYAGTISKQKAKDLADQLVENGAWWPKYGITSTPTYSTWFKPKTYWQGPVWFNVNWLLVDGLRRYGFEKKADQIFQNMLELLMRDKEMHEYFSPIDGEPAGTHGFSWSAALAIDLLHHS